jgi:hypothetical protein
MVRSVSISFNHSTIWFQLGMLWDAKFLGIFEIFAEAYPLTHFLMDLLDGRFRTHCGSYPT